MLLVVLCLLVSDHTLRLHLLYTQVTAAPLGLKLHLTDAITLRVLLSYLQVQATLRMQYIQEFYQVTSQAQQQQRHQNSLHSSRSRSRNSS
jgi:hypothetical protein